MGDYAFDNEPCMFFVGGNDNKANNDAAGESWGGAGGCTKQWWDTELGGLTIDDGQNYNDAARVAMGKLMNTDGSPIATLINAAVVGHVPSSLVFSGPSGSFDGVETGMLVCIVHTGDNVMKNGDGLYYVASASPSGQSLTVTGETHPDIENGFRADVYIGGAFTSIPEIAEEINCDSYSQQILCNKDKTNVPATTVSNWGHGDAAKNTWLCIHGFNRVPYDIVNPAGVYYQCVKDAFDNGAVADSFVKFGNGSLNDTLFTLDEVENIHFEGFRFIGTGGANGMFRSTTSSSENHILKHCLLEFSGNLWAFFYYSQSHRIILEDVAVIGVASYRNLLTTSGVIYLRNVVMRGDPARIMNDNSNETVILSHVIMIDGIRQINMASVGGQAFVMDSTFRECTFAEFYLGGTGSNSVFLASFGNIHELINTADKVVVMMGDASPASMYMSNDNAWSEAGQLDEIGFNNKTNAEDPIVHDVIEVDPALDGDLHPTNKTLREYGPFGQWKWLGAIHPITDLPDVANVTEDDTVDDEAGTFAVPAVGDVESGVGYGEDGTELTGTFLPPATPTFTLAEGDGQVTATIAGDAGIDHYLLYKKPSDTAWQAGGNRNGDGDITATGLSDGVPYIFVVYSFLNSVPSVPAIGQLVTLAGDTDDEASIDGAMSAGYAQLIEHMGVMVTYRPAGGGSRPIKAIVHQKQPSALGGAQGATSTHTTVMVLNDATVGISSAEVDTGGDKIEIATRIGKAAQARRIVAPILFHNASVMKVRVS